VKEAIVANWQPTGAWMQRFRRALDHSFDETAIELLTSDYFHPASFARISSPGAGKTFEFRLYELIQQARMEDWLLDLVAAARERRPGSAEIAKIAEELGLTITGPRVDNPTGLPLEALIREKARFINPATFYERLPALEGQVCWIDIPGGGGTGFLVGPDLVLTNQHVVAPIAVRTVRAQDVRCVFDYREPADGPALTRKKPTEAALAAPWHVGSWPPSRFDWDPTLGDAAPGEIDAALIRLADRVGDLPLGGASGDPTAPARGWIPLKEQPPPLVAGEQVFLLQHPKGGVLRLTIGSVTEFNATGTRVRYDANSRDGSSGAPCFDADLRLVALHHAHDPAYPPAWNQAVPLAVLQKVWQDEGVVLPDGGE
jgi:hypothetical protein